MRNLPQELVEQVIDDVAATFDLTEVATCGLICRQYLPRSRKHLFANIHLSDWDESAIVQKFVDLVDASCTPILPLVKSLNIHLVDGALSDVHMGRLHECHAIRHLRIRAPHHQPAERHVFVQDLPFQNWLQAHIQHFACTLNRFELVMGSDIPLSLLVDIICSLPHLTHLRIDGDCGYGVFASDPVLATQPFPRNLYSLDMAIHRGTNLFFDWLLSYDQPPCFTSFTLGGTVTTGVSTLPIEGYLKRVAPMLQSFSSSYVANGLLGSYAFENSVIGFADQLVRLSLDRQYPKYLAEKMTYICSIRLRTICIVVRPVCSVPARGDWPAIDALLATPQYASLERLVLTDEVSRASLATEEMRVLMPRANARGILY
ncbi:hypothetical protein C8R47DRAFT_1327216 [Mycena vitilis]|nr:hypothetical protein C8R47DRAFT_1327216 [Mycena vitilis]